MARNQILCVCLLAAAAVHGQTAATHHELSGTLQASLVAGDRFQTEILTSGNASDRASLPLSLTASDSLFVGTTFFEKDKPLKLALAEPAAGDPILFADVNRNGSFEANEQFTLPTPDRMVLVKVPLNGGPFAFYPIRFKLPAQEPFHRGNDRRVILRSPFAFVQGSVMIAGQNTLVEYQYNLDKRDAYPDYGWIGMDVNGDGHIDERSNGDEHTVANDEGVVFRVRGHDFSTLSLNVNTRQLVLLEHPAGGSLRIPLHASQPIPDFAFTDLDGKTHHFSEFRGRYVLLDFWGTWCPPCRQELPIIEKASQQFRARKFVVLGMNDERDVAKVRQFLERAGITFPQSTGDTGHDLVHQRFRINAFPTKVLVDPAGKIMDEPPGDLRGERLSPLLDSLLP